MTTYHVDAVNGHDQNDGTVPDRAWKTLDRAMRHVLRPGDSLLLKRGCVWKEFFKIKGRGTKRRPITVGTYGEGPKPRLISSADAIISNDGPVSWWRIKGLDLCGSRPFNPRGRKPGTQNGIVINENVSSVGLVIEDCVVHDVSGKGILLNAQAVRRSIFREWAVIDCEVYNAGTGIATDGIWPAPAGQLSFYQSFIKDFRVEGCRVHDIATDGIVLYNCQDGVIERCMAWRTGIGKWHRTPVGIWLFIARRCIIQFCESYDNHTAGGKADGGGFDLDGGCTDCVMQYNYSHDNDGAGFLICSYDPVLAPCERCTVRFNLSVNDGRANDFAAIQVWQADECDVYNNTCITRTGYGLKFASTTRGNIFANNIFVIETRRDIPFIKSPYSLSGNTFTRNLYWRPDGKGRFEVESFSNLSLKELAPLISGAGDRIANPKLTAYHGPDIRIPPDSPAATGGQRLKEMGDRDLYGQRLRGNTRHFIGAALPLRLTPH